MVPLMALFAVVLLGCTAIATDLSVSTHYKRNLQNVTDAAALEGAKQLPVAVAAAAQVTATTDALAVLHNTFPWTEGALFTPAALAASKCNSVTLQCSVTLCAGLTVAGCTTVPQGPNQPFSLTVNTPPKTALNATFNNSDLSVDPHYYQRMEVIMHQQSGGFFSGILGVTSEVAGGQSVAYHFASGQAFPFALFSKTVVQSGNSPEIIYGNIYAERYLAPQDSATAICAAPDKNGNNGYIVLGSPQGGDSGYANDGQHNNPKVKPNADPITDNFPDCTTIGSGQVAMTGNPAVTPCANAFGPELSGSTITFNTVSDACEATPALAVPTVASLPNYTQWPTTKCWQNPAPGSVADPQNGQYGFQCNGNNQPSLNITSNITMKPGVYEIWPSGNAPCDVTIDGTLTNMTGVTFFLEQGAGICATISSSGVNIYQTPYCGTCSPGPATPGDGVYDVVSDNSGLNPSVTMTTTGGGGTSGVWNMTGVIWLPTGTVTISNKTEIADTGQILVNSWNDTSGSHPNPSVIYNGKVAPTQNEQLQLVE